MSGITGILTTHQSPISATTLQAMTDVIRHRGPDAEGHYSAEQIALGYRHFDVHGLTIQQAQTMLHLDRYAITFDGRIYNLPELQAELSEKGYSFTCESEAQLLAAAYDHWGTDCLNKLNADWAFVLYDTHTQKLFIARDRFGVKPLYYYTDNTSFIFSSEIKSIYASGLVQKEFNEKYLKAYLEKGANEYDASTAFKNIVRFPFAHYFYGSLDELLNTPLFTRYWELKVNTTHEKFDPSKAQQYANQYYALLTDAVRIRMRGKVKIGAALSGGLDSSSIVYIMHQELQKEDINIQLQTFSSVYKSPGTEHCDESEFINIVANQLGVFSNQIEPNVKDIPAEHEKMIWAMENPPDNTLMSSWYTFTKVRSKGYKITLDGQGADEQLAGYLRFTLAYLMSLSLIDFYKEFFYFLLMPGAKKVTLISFLMKHYKLVFGNSIYRKTFKKIRKKEAPYELNEELKRSLEKQLVTLLHYADHTSSAFSIESHMPFMDYRLIYFLAEVPACYKMHKGWSKYLARLAFNKKLPNEINWRKDKMGWPIPEEQWLRQSLRKWALNLNQNLEKKETFLKKIRRINLEAFKRTWSK